MINLIMDKFILKKDLKQGADYIHIQGDIYFKIEKKETRFGIIETKPSIVEICEYLGIKSHITGLFTENYMGFSTQVPAKITYYVEQAIEYKGHHSIIEVPRDKRIFTLNHLEYQILYCLNFYSKNVTEHKPYIYFPIIKIKQNLINSQFELRGKSFEVNIEKVKLQLGKEALRLWEALALKDFELYNKLDDEDKVAYYLFWNSDDKLETQLNCRTYGELDEVFTQSQLNSIQRKLFS